MDNSELVDKIIAAARVQVDLKTPFRHQGRIPGLGLDCAGLMVHSFSSAGLPVQDTDGYGRSPSFNTLEKTVASQPFLTRTDVLEPGTVLIMRFAGDPQHLALYTRDDTIIHSYEAVGFVCEHGLDKKWRNRIIEIHKLTDQS